MGKRGKGKGGKVYTEATACHERSHLTRCARPAALEVKKSRVTTGVWRRRFDPVLIYGGIER